MASAALTRIAMVTMPSKNAPGSVYIIAISTGVAWPVGKQPITTLTLTLTLKPYYSSTWVAQPIGKQPSVVNHPLKAS